VRNETEKSQSRRSGAPMGLRSAYPRVGAPVGIEDLPSQAEERG